MDPVMLARIQFAMTVGFHFIFPPISIGLAWFLVMAEWKAWRQKSPEWEAIARLFGKIFAITFAVGVATGITMEFQFGTNWAAYSRFVGGIFGAPLAAEGIFAFFLESSFLGLYLFGRNRIPKGAHWFSILMVGVGTVISAFWILAANSWQQTPAGHEVIDGKAVLVDFSAAIFNASMWPRFFHTMVAALITGAFTVAGILAIMLLRSRPGDRQFTLASKALKPVIIAALVLSVLEAFPFGDIHARQVAQTQPAKFATIEGVIETSGNVPALVFGIPVSQDPPKIIGRVEIPSLMSIFVHGDPKGVIAGLDQFAPQDRPPLALTFTTFHLMVMLGMLFILLGFLGVLLLRKDRLFTHRPFLTVLALAIPLPTLANQLGWITAEVGRQPWVVQGLLRTRDAVSINVGAGELLFSIIGFALIYALMLVLYLKLVARKVGAGFPEDDGKEVSYGA
jgi:cytochrome d ubiquinol oxidase subunit I